MSYDDFRTDIRDQLRQMVPGDIQRKVLLSQPLADADYHTWHRILYDKGWITPAWPVEFGGTGWDDTQNSIFDEECYLAAAPRIWPMGVKLIGPVIYTFGTDEQKDRHLGRIRSGEDFWCQGFSEPNAGSDLASLKTRAEFDGRDYIVNGQKIWTTQAHIANLIFCLVRTSRENDKRAGITLLLIDMESPGVEVRRIRNISSYHSVNEVYFENVRVPLSNRIGEEGEGWKYTKFILKNERLGLANIGLCKLEYHKLALLVDVHKETLQQECRLPELYRQMERVETRINALDGLNRLYCDIEDVRKRQELPSVLKVMGSEIQQTLAEIKLNFFGDKSFRGIRETSVRGLMMSEAINDYFEKRKVSIYGGANEVQRDLIARAVGVSAG